LVVVAEKAPKGDGAAAGLMNGFEDAGFGLGILDCAVDPNGVPKPELCAGGAPKGDVDLLVEVGAPKGLAGGGAPNGLL